MTLSELAQTVVKATDNVQLPVFSCAPILSTSAAGIEAKATVKQDQVTLTLFPSILKLNAPLALSTALAEVGRAWMNAHPERHDTWERKLLKADVAQINEFQSKLSSQKFKTFAELVRSYSRSTDRLVAIHLANGILASGQKMATASNLDVKTWGSTSEFAVGKIPYSLVPLLSVYAPTRITACFGEAYAEWVLNNLSSVNESSVAVSMANLIKHLLKVIPPE